MSTPTDVREVLAEWVRRCGPGFLDEPRRVRAVLHDGAPHAPQRVALVTAALEEGVAQRIRSTPAERLPEEIDRLTAELAGRRQLPGPDVAWAVTTVAEALGAPVAHRGRRGRLVLAGVCAGVVLVGGLIWLLATTGGPPAPGDVRAQVEDGEIVLEWVPASDAARYEIYRDGALLADTTATTYTDSDVEGGSTYWYRVRTVDASGDRSEPSDSTSVTAGLARPEISEPTVEGSTVTLRWAPVPGADRYEVDREGASVAVDLTGTSVTEEGVPAGRWVYTVTAVDDDGDGGRSSAGVSAPVQPWGVLQPVASAYPELFPAIPDASLPGPIAPHSCSAERPLREGADGEVVCRFDNGIVVVVMLLPTAVAVREEVQTLSQGRGVGTWWCGSADRIKGDHVHGTWEDGVPYEFLNFRDPDLARFTLYVEWPAHGSEQLADTFLPSGILCSA